MRLYEFAPSPGYGRDDDGEEKGDWKSFIEILTRELKAAGFNTSKDPAHNTPTGRLFFYVRKPPHDWDVVVVMQSTSNPGKVYYKVSRSSAMLKPGEDELIDHGVCPMTAAGAAWIQPRIEKAVGLDTGLAEEQLDELSFLGSQCTKDCSGHRAGYAWSQKHGGMDSASWSPSFNKGAWLHNNGF